ncbi:site-specific integrase [Actinoplanes sp. NPDC024001]|uniref:tyrosine-type recombinase/integrase n=1 Tax=Actinoplanes sp. NPDC024001 TaxID=3154598 RepID=UPI0033E4BDD3
MTLVAVAPSIRENRDDERAEERLRKALDPNFLGLMRWNDDHQVLYFPQGHQQLGWDACLVVGCHKDSRFSRVGLCQACHNRWKRSGEAPLEEFRVLSKTAGRAIGVSLCAVTDCERPWKTKAAKLCTAHHWQWQRAGRQALRDFLASDGVVPFPGFGPCSVAACTRDRHGRGHYCHQHDQRFARAVRANPGLDVEQWRRRQGAIAENEEVSLRGLPARVVAELLYGLQQRTQAGAKTRYWIFRPLCDRLREAEVARLDDFDSRNLPAGPQRLFAVLRRESALLHSNPDLERRKDVWDLNVFGLSGTLKFAVISQRWLREAVKRWAADDLPTRRGNRIAGVVQTRINALGRLSQSLRLQRDDGGDYPSALSRDDITSFCNRMAFLMNRGEITENQRLVTLRMVRNLLLAMRGMGLARSGQPLTGLPDDFHLQAGDMPDAPEKSEAGKDLPTEVMRHICDHLPGVTKLFGHDIRVAFELFIDTGRRADEVCQLQLECLDRDGEGKPVLIYNNSKGNRQRRRLPIPAATAATIVAQQERVRARFPNVPPEKLKLLPSPVMNPNGHKAITAEWVTSRHRDWIDHLPDITVQTHVEEHGKAVTKMLPFEKGRIHPHAYRHTYAQRHADAGVDVTVLKELMDHEMLSTTQGYYRVGETRRREAIDRVTTMQFDRHGSRVWRNVQALLDDEHARRAVGEVAVPYGGCSEPSNVAASGQDCPIRFRCIGCGHFSTDISYLPDLERYLADLLRHRERLTATINADEWARNEAIPSDDEITRIRRLIDRMKADFADLTSDEKAQINDAVTLVRRARRGVIGLGLPRVRQPLPDVRPERAA